MTNTRWPLVIDGTRQELFNKVVAHLRRQGKRAVKGHGNNFGCSYESSEGLRCGIGALLPEDLTREEARRLDNTGAVKRCVEEGLLQFSSADVAYSSHFTRALQTFHDERGQKKWLAAQRMAEDYGLNADIATDPSLPAWPEAWE